MFQFSVLAALWLWWLLRGCHGAAMGAAVGCQQLAPFLELFHVCFLRNFLCLMRSLLTTPPELAQEAFLELPRGFQHSRELPQQLPEQQS